MDAATLLGVWRSSKWRQGALFEMWSRKPADGRRGYPSAQVMSAGDGTWVVAVELWARGRQRPLGARTGVRQWGAPGFKSAEAAMKGADRWVERVFAPVAEAA